MGWSLDFLKINLGEGYFSVYFSDTDKFRYFDEKKRKDFGDDFLVGLERKDMKFPEFVELIRNWKEGDKRYCFNLSIDFTYIAMLAEFLRVVLFYLHALHNSNLYSLIQLVWFCFKDIPSTSSYRWCWQTYCDRFLRLQLELDQ